MRGRTLAIAGSGVVSLYTALLLRRRLDPGVRIMLYGSAPAENKGPSRDLLINARHWRRLIEFGIAAPAPESVVKRIRLSAAGVPAPIVFSEDDLPDAAIDSFGAVIAARGLRSSLYGRIQADARIELVECGPGEIRIEESPRHWRIDGGAEGAYEPDLLIIADRAQVPARANAPDRCGLIEGDFSQEALSGIVELDHGLGNTAWQLFLPSGPLALLPLGEERMASFIWTLDDSLAQEMTAAGEQRIAESLQAHLAGRFGRLRLRHLYPASRLRWHQRRKLRSGQMLLLGEAARSIHPMAGIGANLGFYGADRLGLALSQGRPGGLGAGLGRWAREYDSYGQLIHMILRGIRGLEPALQPGHPLSALVPKGALAMMGAIAASPWLRRRIAATAMGPGDSAPASAEAE